MHFLAALPNSWVEVDVVELPFDWARQVVGAALVHGCKRGNVAKRRCGVEWSELWREEEW